MNKEEILVELNSLISLIPENLSTQDRTEKLKKSVKLSKAISETEEELIKVLNNAEDIDEATSIDLNDKKLDLQAAEKALRRSKIDSQSYLDALISFEKEVIIPAEEELNRFIEADKKDKEKGLSTQGRIDKIRELELKVKNSKEVLEKNKKENVKYEEYISSCEEKVNIAKRELKKVEDEISNKLNLSERTMLENRLTALKQLQIIVNSNPYEELKSLISDYENNKINDTDVKNRLGLLTDSFYFPNLDKSHEKELEEVLITRQRLEREVEDLETISSYNSNFNSGVVMPIENFYKIESQKIKFKEKLAKLRDENFSDQKKLAENISIISTNTEAIESKENKREKLEEKIKVINSNINVNPKLFSESVDEDGIKYGSLNDYLNRKIEEFKNGKEISARENELTEEYNKKKNNFDINRRRNNRQGKIISNRIILLKQEITDLKMENQALELENRKINTNSQVRMSNIEKYESLLNRNVNNYKYEDLLPKK